MKKKMIKYGLMFSVACLLSLIFLKLANDFSGYWINISWVLGVWFGIETVLFLDLIKEHKPSGGG